MSPLLPPELERTALALASSPNDSVLRGMLVDYLEHESPYPYGPDPRAALLRAIPHMLVEPCNYIRQGGYAPASFTGRFCVYENARTSRLLGIAGLRRFLPDVAAAFAGHLDSLYYWLGLCELHACHLLPRAALARCFCNPCHLVPAADHFYATVRADQRYIYRRCRELVRLFWACATGRNGSGYQQLLDIPYKLLHIYTNATGRKTAATASAAILYLEGTLAPRYQALALPDKEQAWLAYRRSLGTNWR